MKHYESAAQLAERIGVNACTIWRWVTAGRLPKPQKFSPGCTRFDSAAVDEALAKTSYTPRTAQNTRAAHVAAEKRRAAKAALAASEPESPGVSASQIP